ncbi:MAG: DHH family phosphoesterase [Candidatus Zophobacter franzmannii]|nr:DHH family phosphoesterase [Candidatus Zophobacter franzmannii]
MKDFKNKLLIAVEKYKSICILTHHEPDGDGLPSALALKKVLESINRNADIVLEEDAPEQFNYLQAQENSRVIHADMKYDLAIALDCHELKRLGTVSFLAENAKECFIIDHHVAEDGIIPHAQFYIKHEIACVGILIFEMFETEISKLPLLDMKYCGDCIYSAILNDTNSFMNANTDKNTLLAASRLEKYGVVYGDVTEKYFYNDPWRKLKLVGLTMATLESHFQEKVLFLHTTQDMLILSQIGIEYLTKIISWVRSAKDILMIVHFKEADDGSVKLSFRSKTINVAKIAKDFNGGGHIQAAGGTISKTLTEAKNAVIDRLKECNELRDYLN